MRCQSCGYENQIDSVYCGQCRTALTRPCRSCGEPAPLAAPACPACGASLAAAMPYVAVPPSHAPPSRPPMRARASAAVTRVHSPAVPAGAAAAGRASSAQAEGNRFAGVARDVQRDTAEQVWHFRIERHDASGNKLAAVPVEMKLLSVSGTVSNGDEVRVKGKWRRGTLRVRGFDNLTTGAEVRGNQHLVVNAVLGTVLVLIFLGMFGFLAVTFVRSVILGDN